MLGAVIFSMFAYALFFLTRSEEKYPQQPYIFDEKLLDKIDKEFVDAIRKLPDCGNILDDNKKLKLENVLGLLK